MTIAKHVLKFVVIVGIFFVGLLLEVFIEKLPVSSNLLEASVEILSDLFPVFGSLSIFAMTWFAYRKSRDNQYEKLALAEEKLKKSEARLRLQIDRMPIGCILWNSEFRAASWNPAAEQIFGFKADEVLGKHTYDFIVPRDVQPHLDTICCRLLEGDTTAHSVNENMTKDGRTIICSWSNTPLKEADGTVIGVLSMVQNVTAREQAEKALRGSEEKSRILAEDSPNMIFVNKKGKVVYANKKCEEITGYKNEFYHPDFDFITLIAPEYTDIVQGEEIPPYELAIITKDGKRIETILTTSLISYGGACHFRDIDRAAPPSAVGAG